MIDIKAVGYVISDKENNVIYGHGATVDDAWAEVVSMVRGDFGQDIDDKPLTEEQAFERHYRVHGATEALLARVTQDGGAISWDIVRRTACTPEEVETMTMTTYRLIAFDTEGTKVSQADVEAQSERDAFDKHYKGHGVTCEINRGETMFTFPDGRSVLVSVVR